MKDKLNSDFYDQSHHDRRSDQQKHGIETKLKRPILSFFTPKTAFFAFVLAVGTLVGVSFFTRSSIQDIQEVSREREIMQLIVGTWEGYNKCRSIRVYLRYTFNKDMSFVSEDAMQYKYPGTWEIELDTDYSGLSEREKYDRRRMLVEERSDERIHLHLESGTDVVELTTLDADSLTFHYGDWIGRSGDRCNILLERMPEQDQVSG